jgi:predicted kinase
LARARSAGVGVELHLIDVDAAVRWQRVCQRNEGSSETFSFAVTREMFDMMEARWERPDAEEIAAFEAVEIR